MAGDGHDDFAPTEMWRPEEPLKAAPSPRTSDTQTLAIRFTGSGSEYFRIWIVNLLLILVTLTLYLPFARARRMAYFQNNTWVGSDPLGFHANPWKMFRGYLIVAVLGVGYSVVNNFAPQFSWLALALFMALWPLLWRASLQFRLRNTSWRGVRLAFLGDAKGAYVAMLPFFLPTLAFVLFLPQEIEGGDPIGPNQAKFAAVTVGAVVLLFVVLMPWFWKRLKAYQHGGYAFAQERTDFTATTGQFYKLLFKVSVVSMLVTMGVGTLVAVGGAAFAGLGADTLRSAMEGKGTATLFVMLGVAVAAIYVLVPLLVGSYMGSRMQNLLWSYTESAQLRLRSQLRMGPLLKVSLVNWLLILFTLGLYWPFAKVRLARLKLEAISVEVDGDVDEWVANASTTGQGVLGDAAGDFFGIDLGL
jgi:uncharacterized membrane protein YjgN (DUF898 family)